MLLAIIQVESGGTLEDVMQSSESLGLPPNSLSTEESIKQGCKYFSELLAAAETKGCRRSIYGPVAQLVRAPPCHGGGREFESLLGRLWGLSSAGRASALQAEGHIPQLSHQLRIR